VNIFYREAGPKDAPVLVLLHGYPSSAHMYRNLINELSDKYHLIAPDYPGYGFQPPGKIITVRMLICIPNGRNISVQVIPKC
jgi:pimeloyl-ACP methyl ester carboxylesterase